MEVGSAEATNKQDKFFSRLQKVNFCSALKSLAPGRQVPPCFQPLPPGPSWSEARPSAMFVRAVFIRRALLSPPSLLNEAPPFFGI